MSTVLAAIGTPPTSPDQVVLPENRRERGRKQVRRDRARCYQELKGVRPAPEKEKRTKKYRKRHQRATKSREERRTGHAESHRTKTRHLL